MPKDREVSKEQLITVSNGRGVAWHESKTTYLPDDVTFGKNDWTLEELSTLTGIRPYHLHLAYLGMAKLPSGHIRQLHKYLLEDERELFDPVRGKIEPKKMYASKSVPKNRYTLVLRLHVDSIEPGDLLYYIDSSGRKYWVKVVEKNAEPLFYVLGLEDGMQALVGRNSYMRVMKKGV